MSGDQETAPARSLLVSNARAASKAVPVYFISTSEGCTPPLTSMFRAKYCEGEFWASTSFLCRRSATERMFSRTTMPSPPLDQSICW